MGRRRIGIVRRRRRNGGPIEILFVAWLFGGIFLGGFKSPLIYCLISVISLVVCFLLNLLIKHVRKQDQLNAENKAQEERRQALEFRLQEERKLMKGLTADNIDSMDGFMFERYIAALLEHKGFKTLITKGSGDHGVDIVAFKDNQRYSIQAKRYNSNKISRTAVSDAVAGKEFYECNMAMVITNSYFSPAAINYAEKTKCILVNREVLAEWINGFHDLNTFNDLFLNS